MKKIGLMCLLFVLGVVSAFGQKGEKSVGINLGYGTASSVEALRLGAEFNWNATDHIRLSPSFDYYFSRAAVFVVSADVHYLLPVAEKVTVYPLVGVTYMNQVSNEFGGNVGAGAEYEILPRWNLSAEVKYEWTDGLRQFGLGAGLAYKF